jgi:hypothetical protein
MAQDGTVTILCVRLSYMSIGRNLPNDVFELLPPALRGELHKSTSMLHQRVSEALPLG